MIDYLINLDSEILLFFNGMHCAFFDRFMLVFTGKFVWIVMYVAILYAIIRKFSWKTTLCYVIAIALVITISDQLVASVIRPYYERLRPANLQNPISTFIHIVDGYRGGLYSFPSCHAANSFALAMITSLIFSSRRYTTFIFIWAIVNSYTRLYLGVHYPGDLIVGALIGSFVGALIYSVTRLIVVKTSSHKQLITIHTQPQYPKSDIIIAIGLATTIVIAIYSLFTLL